MNEEHPSEQPEPPPPPDQTADVSKDRAFTRREFISTSSGAIGGGMVAAHWLGSATTAGAVEAGAKAAELSSVALEINGAKHALKLDPRVSLLDALREHLHLTGSKKGCDHGQCGACTVLVNGRRINACLTLAVMHEGDKITTIEGLGTPAKLHPMQAAFVKHDGFQCGYCTPGQICSAVAMLGEIKDGIPSHVSADLLGEMSASEEEIRERMSGNLCRCAAYANIVAAVREVASKKGEGQV